jgi:uncharacterized protein
VRVLVSGATGFIGRALVEELSANGAQVAVLSRDASTAQARVPTATDFFSWRDGETLPRGALAGRDAVVHLAGESVQGRWTARKRKAIRDSRVLSTQGLVAALAALPAAERPRVLVSASATGYYGSQGETELTEDAGSDDSFLAEVCQEWEAQAMAAAAHGVRVVTVRTGIVIHPEGGALAAMRPAFRMGLGGPIAGGRQWWSWIHRDDVVGLFAFALEEPRCSGPLNAVAAEPVRQADFARALARALRRPAFLPTPGFALRLAVGDFASELLASRRVVPAKAVALGYHFRVATLAQALGR